MTSQLIVDTIRNAAGTAVEFQHGATVPTIDINGGTIDGAVIGGAVPAAGSFTTLSATWNISTSDSYSLAWGAAGSYIQGSGHATAGYVNIVSNASNGYIKQATAGGYSYLNASGNLGLGVVPSAWDGPKALQIGNGAIGSMGFETDVFNNVYYNGSFRYITTGISSYYSQSNGANTWYTAPSGTAGDPISFTQAMSLDASNNLTVLGTVTGSNLSGTNTGDQTLPTLSSLNGQPLDADLTAIAALAGTNGLLKKTAADTWVLDTTAYTTNLGTVTGVTGTAPIVSSGGTAPAISINAATTSVAGSMSAADKTKLDAITGTNTGNQTSIVGITGTLAQFNTAVTDADLAPINSPTFTGTATIVGYTETTYNLAGTDIAVANGTIQTKTLSADTTFTESLVDGQSVILGITAGAYSVTWPSVTWAKVGGSGTAPTLTSTGVNWIILWQVGGVVRGSFMGTA